MPRFIAPNSSKDYIGVGEAAETLNVSADTLRRWDTKGILKAHHPTGTRHRYYLRSELELFLLAKKDLAALAEKWAMADSPHEPENGFYCQTRDIFTARLQRLESESSKLEKYLEIFPLLVAIAGEIGNNSFDHNLGSWPDIPGIFFGYDLVKGQVVLADRGQGLLRTLKRVQPRLQNESEAMKTAFTETISGRAPEARGNGLKFVRQVVLNGPFALRFRSGNAELKLRRNDDRLRIGKRDDSFHGCTAVIRILE